MNRRSVVDVVWSPSGCYAVRCDLCHGVFGSFVTEGHAHRQACVHYVDTHMPWVVGDGTLVEEGA